MGQNLVDACVSAGADCALGFQSEISAIGLSSWARDFFGCYSQGRSVSEAAHVAGNTFLSRLCGFNLYYIAD